MSIDQIAISALICLTFILFIQGKWRYENVETWRGVVCEMVTSKWLEQNFKVDKPAKGLDNSGVFDDCDMIINSKKVEIKSATKNYFRYII